MLARAAALVTSGRARPMGDRDERDASSDDYPGRLPTKVESG